MNLARADRVPVVDRGILQAEPRKQNSEERIQKSGACSSQVPIDPGVAKADAWTDEFSHLRRLGIVLS
jgi:hypothetical protein